MPRFRYFDRLPPFLRVVNVLTLLFPLAALVLLGIGNVILPGLPQRQVVSIRLLGIAMNLVTLFLPCVFVVDAYTLRFRRPGRETYPLDSWQSQAGWLLVLAVVPLGALALSVWSPPPPSVNVLVTFPIFLAFLVYFIAWVYMSAKWHARI